MPHNTMSPLLVTLLCSVQMIQDHFDDQRGVERSSMVYFVETYFLETFGMKQLANEKHQKLVNTCLANKQNVRVRMFG